jgi:hypothetical protein
MLELLTKMIGHRLDVYCGGSASLRGEVLQVEGEVLILKDDEGQLCYVAVGKIICVWESRGREHNAGFVSAGFK